MLYLFFTGGSDNRGCEAIVRGTLEILGERECVVFTASVPQEQESGLSDDVECRAMVIAKNGLSAKLNYLKCGLSYKFGNGKLQVKTIYRNFFQTLKPGDKYLVIGGDVYCYGKPYIYYRANEICSSNKHILWGCSIEPKSIDGEMIKDLKSYSLIYARESITYDALVSAGCENVILAPDPAFAMPEIRLPLPEGFQEGNTIGINVSPLIQECEAVPGITLKNYERLIEYILRETKEQIALIPHVIWPNSDDRKPLQALYDKYKETGRLVLIDGVPAREIKGYISRCNFMVVARTHASIAAYSTCVPTLVVGYSVKARGIAKDLFGVIDDYVIPVQSLQAEDDLLNSFMRLYENRYEIRAYLNVFVPAYKQKLQVLSQDLKKVLD